MENPYRDRVDEMQVAWVLHLIATVPNRREQPIAGDLPGMFDFWFDGGAGRMITGRTDYELADGTRVTVAVIPILSVTIDFANGARVQVVQESRSVRVP
jgi:hypothetical protein